MNTQPESRHAYHNRQRIKDMQPQLTLLGKSYERNGGFEYEIAEIDPDESTGEIILRH